MQTPFPVPTPLQLAWQRTETNLFFHFGINTFTDQEWGNGTEDPTLFNPSRLDCRQWARAAKAGGFRIGILTAKHHDGFCLWPSRFTNHSVASSPWKAGKGDVVREFVDAFRAEGLKVGLYLSPWDRHQPSYGSDSYNDYYCNQLTELLTQYGELHEMWFDGACAEGPTGKRQEYDWPRFFRLVKELQPGAVTFSDGGTDVRWVGNERGIAGSTCWSTVDPDCIRFPGDQGIDQPNNGIAMGEKPVLNEGHIPDGKIGVVWRPAECDVSIRPGWFYHEKEDGEVRSVENLVDLYFQSVGRNGTLLLNIPPTPEGLLHSRDVENATGFRQQLDNLFADDLARGGKASATGEQHEHRASHVLDGGESTYWAAEEGKSSASIEIELEEAKEIGLICLQEPIQIGQAVAAYHVEFQGMEGTWKTVTSGTTIGYKKLDRIQPMMATRVRVVLDQTVSLPALAAIRLYSPTGEGKDKP